MEHRTEEGNPVLKFRSSIIIHPKHWYIQQIKQSTVKTPFMVEYSVRQRSSVARNNYTQHLWKIVRGSPIIPPRLPKSTHVWCCCLVIKLLTPKYSKRKRRISNEGYYTSICGQRTTQISYRPAAATPIKYGLGYRSRTRTLTLNPNLDTNPNPNPKSNKKCMQYKTTPE